MKNDGVNPADAAVGVIGYTERIMVCPVTGKPTNLVFRNRNTNKHVVAIDQHAANLIGTANFRPFYKSFKA